MAALVLIAAASGAAAAPVLSGPEDRQAVRDLAYVLGQSHALRQVCKGSQDQYWRERMQALLKLEGAPDHMFRAALARAFNSGFEAGRANHPACSAATRAEAVSLAARGRALSAALAGLGERG